MKRNEIRVAEKAFRERWPISKRRRDRTITEMIKIIEDPEQAGRTKTAAAKVLIAADAQNVSTEAAIKPKKVELDVTTGGKPIESPITRIELYAAAFESATDREEESDSASDSVGKRLDSRFHQNGTNGQAG